MTLGGKLNGLDLFSGIGGNTLALREWVKTVAYCEYDKHAQSVLLSRMADGSIERAPIWDDIRSLKGDMFDVPIDIIVGGFPCQDISVAGKGAGISGGERSGLFFEIVRLIDELRPSFLFLENVPAIRTRGLDIVLRELTQRGYDCRWTMLSAAQVGARHKRERWFMLANRRNSDGANPEHTRRDAATLSGGNKASVCNGKEGPNGSGKSTGMDSCRYVANSDKRGLPSQGAEQQATGTAGEGENVSYSQGERIQRLWTSREQITDTHEKSPIFMRNSKTGGEAERSTKSRLGGVAYGIPDWLDEGLPHYLRASYWEKEPEEIPRVTEEREQRVERIKRLGNSVVPLQAKAAFKRTRRR